MSDEKPAVPFSTPQMVELEAQAALARLELASTIDAITARLTPKALLDEATSQAKSAAGNARGNAQRIFRDATSADADPEASTRARVILASATAVVTLVVAASLLRRRGGRHS
jgi:hypothetical protein